MPKKIFFPICYIFFLFFASKALALDAYLAWVASPAPDTAGYKIYIDTISHASNTCPNNYANYKNPINTGNTTNYTVNNLNAGFTYYFQITAYNTTGEQSECSLDPGRTKYHVFRFFNR